MRATAYQIAASALKLRRNWTRQCMRVLGVAWQSMANFIVNLNYRKLQHPPPSDVVAHKLNTKLFEFSRRY